MFEILARFSKKDSFDPGSRINGIVGLSEIIVRIAQERLAILMASFPIMR